MLSMSKLGKAGKPNAKGELPLDYLKDTELKKIAYYHDSEALPLALAIPQWGGAGAAALGLSGEVDFEKLEKLAAAHHPVTGKDLVKGAGDEHQVGTDLTWSAPKSVSAAFVAADEERRMAILQAHQNAVDAGLKYIESVATSRVGYNGTKEIGVKGLVTARFQHFASRELDPQLHTHSLVLNLAHCDDGKWRTLNSMSIFQHKMAAGAIYRAELAAQLSELGWGIRKEGRDSFEIEGFKDEDLVAISTRRAQIEAELRRVGGKGANASQHAAMATRREKDEPPYEHLMRDWTKQLKELGYNAERIAEFFRDAEEKRLERPPFVLNTKAMLSAITEQRSIFVERDLVRLIAAEAVGRWDAKRCRSEAKQLMLSPEVIALGKGEDGHTRYTTREMYQLEEDTLKSVEARINETRHQVDSKLVLAAIEETEKKLGPGARLNDEQRAAVIHLCEKTGGTAFIEGWAGTGKTTMLSALQKAYDAAGFMPIGCALSGKAAEGLQNEANIPSHTLASLLRELESGGIQLTEKNIIVIDEAGMVGSRMFRQLQERVDAAGAKLCIVGDPKQIQPIEAGGMMRSLMIKHDQLRAELSGIQRQKTNIKMLREALKGDGPDKKPVMSMALRLRMGRVTDKELKKWAEELGNDRVSEATKKWAEKYDYEWMRAVVTDFATVDDTHRRPIPLATRALQTMESKGLVEILGDRESAVAKVVNDWMADSETLSNKLILAATKEEVFSVNNAARARLISEGKLDDKHTLRVFLNDQKTVYRDFAKGDRILFTGINKRMGVKNGTLGEVLGIFKDRKSGKELLKVRLDGDPPKEIIFDPERVRSLDHGYCVTTHKSQGATVNSAYVMLNESMSDREWIYVAASRSRFRTKLYGVEIDLGHLLPDNYRKMEKVEQEATRKALWLQETGRRLGKSNAKETSLDYAPVELAEKAPVVAPAEPVAIAANGAPAPEQPAKAAEPAPAAAPKKPVATKGAFRPKNKREQAPPLAP